ncbi:MAG: tRNA preQ1(34) S-adenosylmethionine ribosyltransferase-isomerase QueA [Phycisphaerales bacterium]|nr:tRNA preQ1(34) S-adenosylmethionine ribosyltransferase-isomerase QueA [Phycisphaerales bacterium]
MRTSELDYDLPPELIATRPAEPRDSARMLVCSRSDPTRIEHVTVAALDRYLDPGDVMARNVTRVVPARIAGVRADSSGKVDGLFHVEHAPGEWRVLLKSNGKLRAGQRIDLIDARAGRENAHKSAWQLELIEQIEGEWRVRVWGEGDVSARTVLAGIGATPLPPYILRARAQRGDAQDDACDRRWYQTLFAEAAEMAGSASVAAPTAGLHFTEALLGRIESRGVGVHDVVLEVGVGTFKPIETDTVEAHDMHAEKYWVSGGTLDALRAAKAAGKKRLIVGTTSVRCLESVEVDARGDQEGETRLFIQPGFDFTWTDALLTNFHLPRSTLMALVGALFPAGVERVREIYAEAVRAGYRFYSYGDAMLVLE